MGLVNLPRAVGGMKPYQVLLAMMVFPSIPHRYSFTVLYYYSANGLDTSGFYSLAW